MKEFDGLPPVDQSVIQAQVKAEYKWFGRERDRTSSGLTLFEFDPNTGRIEPANIIQSPGAVLITGGAGGKVISKETTGSKKVNKKEGCEYLWALNQESAEKKVLKAMKRYQMFLKAKQHDANKA